jgi:hypothetical protein
MTKTWLEDSDLMVQELLNHGIPHHYYDQMSALAEWAVVTHSLARQHVQAKGDMCRLELARLLELPVLKRPIYQPNPNLSFDKATDQAVTNNNWPTTAQRLSRGILSVEFIEGILDRLRLMEAKPELLIFSGIDSDDGLWLAKSMSSPLLVACPVHLEEDLVRHASTTGQMRTYPVFPSGLDPQRSRFPADLHPVDTLWKIIPGREDAWVRLNLLSGASALHSLVLPDPGELKMAS